MSSHRQTSRSNPKPDIETPSNRTFEGTGKVRLGSGERQGDTAMTTLFEKLLDLSVRVGDIEARIAAFKATQTKQRDRKVCELKSEVQSYFQELENDIRAAEDEVSTTWTGVNQSLKEKAQKLRSLVEGKEQAVSLERAENRANRLEKNALFAIDFAALAVGEAEVAISEAIDARLHASEVGASRRNLKEGAI
jgi:hypothetical protein